MPWIDAGDEGPRLSPDDGGAILRDSTFLRQDRRVPGWAHQLSQVVDVGRTALPARSMEEPALPFWLSDFCPHSIAAPTPSETIESEGSMPIEQSAFSGQPLLKLR
jgi:hypothetical protein